MQKINTFKQVFHIKFTQQIINVWGPQSNKIAGINQST